jgi:hypothetical protein
MSSIYVVCAGSSSVNGIYDQATFMGGFYTYDQRGTGTYSIIFNGDTNLWEIVENSSGQPALYSLSLLYTQLPITNDIGSWVVETNGVSPGPQTYNFTYDGNTSLNNKLTQITLTGAGTSAINGVYTYSESVTVSFSTGQVQSYGVPGYSNGLYIITPYTDNTNVGSFWQIYSVANFEPYYTSNIPADEFPINSCFSTDIFYLGEGAAPCCGGFNAICDAGGGTTGGTTGEIVDTSPYFTGKYVYTNNNTHYIRYNNQSYVR